MQQSIESFANEYREELYFRGFSERYPRWLENVESEEEKRVLDKILLKMNFFSKIDIKMILRDKILYYKEMFNELENVQILPMTSENRRHNGSYDLIQQIVEIDRDSYFKGEELLPYKDIVIYDVREIREDVNTVIILDDICGTGGTLEKFLMKNSEFFSGKKLVVFFLVITNVAKGKFELLQSIYNNLELDYIRVEDKLLNSSYLSTEEFEVLKKIEDSLWRKGNNNILGFKDSQLLIGFSHNIPNNTISSIWYQSELGERKEWNELFARYTKKNRPQRKAQNYNVAKSK